MDPNTAPQSTGSVANLNSSVVGAAPVQTPSPFGGMAGTVPTDIKVSISEDGVKTVQGPELGKKPEAFSMPAVTPAVSAAPASAPVSNGLPSLSDLNKMPSAGMPIANEPVGWAPKADTSAPSANSSLPPMNSTAAPTVEIKDIAPAVPTAPAAPVVAMPAPSSSPLTMPIANSAPANASSLPSGLPKGGDTAKAEETAKVADLPKINELPSLNPVPAASAAPVSLDMASLNAVGAEIKKVEPSGLNMDALKVKTDTASADGSAGGDISTKNIPAEFLDASLLPADTPIDKIMKLAEEQDASDIHFATNYPVMLRVYGQLRPVTAIINGDQAKALGMQLLSEERKKIFKTDWEVDFSFTSTANTRFRVNLFMERGNVAGALRLIQKDIRSMEDLELPPVFHDIINEPHGLVLLVGPTGSGKSTTLASMINHINLSRAEHILTIEDPIEYVYPVGKSIVDQRELGADTRSWANSLKSALREDPNIVLVGEMRDLATIQSTITVAETGHLTFATLHTNSASQAIDRMIDVFPEDSKAQIRAQLANVITAVVSQRLIPVQTGGRKAALEVMLGTVAVRNAIREGKTYQIDNIIQTSGDLGMITLEKSLVDMVKKNYISADEAKARSSKPDEIESLLAQSVG